ncbi:hypothetical protein KI387_043697 [Taxus chinensis]|uniref:Uncharacterized protein n=1 Tax=Taxus chinensis TaxID=29808 RepID=A0AA38H023_TAXCH|nr:hypothetical protein KI387_043697 [Taxus chinensis]
MTKHNSVQEILDVVEVTEDPELILDLFTRAMDIQDKYEVTSNPFVSTQAPHSGVKKKDKYEVSHGKEVNEHRPRKEKNPECSSNLNEKAALGQR